MDVRAVQAPGELIAAWALVEEAFPDAPRTRKLNYFLDRFDDESSLFIVGTDGESIQATALGTCSGDHVLVSELCVHPHVRAKGVGRRLLDTLSQAATRLGFDRLVLGSVDDAVGFYLRCGFKPLLYIECGGVDRAQVRDRILAERLRGREVVGSWDEEQFSKAVVWVDQPDLEFRRALDDEYGCGTQYLMVRMLNKQSPVEADEVPAV